MVRTWTEATDEGREIKKKLIDMNMSQSEFCRRNDIKPQRLSEVVHGKGRKYIRKKVYALLNIDKEA